jgi:hypothetical protein
MSFARVKSLGYDNLKGYTAAEKTFDTSVDPTEETPYALASAWIAAV